MVWDNRLGACSNMHDLPNELYKILHVNLASNPLLREHLTVLETPHRRYGIPVLASAAIESIVSNLTKAVDPFKPLWKTMCFRHTCPL